MKQKQRVALTSMENGQSGIVVEIIGGTRMTEKLESLGIRKGAKIVKKSSFLLSGPVIVTVGNTEIAEGHMMALKIAVEVDDQ